MKLNDIMKCCLQHVQLLLVSVVKSSVVYGAYVVVVVGVIVDVVGVAAEI